MTDGPGMGFGQRLIEIVDLPDPIARNKFVDIGKWPLGHRPTLAPIDIGRLHVVELRIPMRIAPLGRAVEDRPQRGGIGRAARILTRI